MRMDFLAINVSIIFILSFTWGQSVKFIGPNSSQCDEHLFCNCSHRSLHQVPRVQANVLGLDLTFNNIKMINQGDLREYKELITLNLHSNKLETIHKQAFILQQHLKTLDLSYNQLANLSLSWFAKLHSLQHLNLLGNKYRTLGPDPLFQSLGKLRTLRFGNPSLEAVRRNDLMGLSRLDEMVFHGSNLRTYDEGSFGNVRPISSVTLSLYGPFLEDPALISKILRDISHPETTLVISDVALNYKRSVQPFSEVRQGGVRKLTLQNGSFTDETMVRFLEVMNDSPVSYLRLEDMFLRGIGKWGEASRTHLKSLSTLYIRNFHIEHFYSFLDLTYLPFLLLNLRKWSIINTTVFVIPCTTSRFILPKLEYLDLSQNLLADMTMSETLCNGAGILRNLRVLNVSQNSLKSLGLMSRLVEQLNKLTALDLSHNNFFNMPESCNWPSGLTYLNLSATKLSRVTPCLPKSLSILDLSDNGLTVFQDSFPNLKELWLSGNRFTWLPNGQLFPRLENLFIQRNTLSMFTKSDLRAYKNLQNLEANQNQFVCSCEFVAFIKGEVEHSVILRDGRLGYVCDSPLALREQTVKSAQLSVWECHMIPAVSILSVGIVLSLLLLGITCHKLHVVWYMQMTWAWLRAKRKPAVGQRTDIRYDAFVSYSEHDAEWVEDFLVPELENAHPPFALCLHKRDFLPGQWIIDNIIDSIEKSHRTLFILSEHFVKSEWCRYELDFSHFRLVDERNDSAILILLEPIVKETVPKRFCKLRKVMNSRTYLEWPEDEERRPEFWHNLKVALKRELVPKDQDETGL